MTQSLFAPSPFTPPSFATVYIPDLQSLNLSEAERATISRLQMRSWQDRQWMLLTDAYYRGMQVITNLGISIPPELADLRVIVGWPKIAVDPYVERLHLDSFRVGNSTIADETLTDLWVHNGMDAEQSIADLEALVMGRSWYVLGSGDADGDPPRICVESPLNMSASWDTRTRRPKEALQSYWLDGRRHAALYLLNQTIHVAEDDNATWQIVDRDVHNFGMLPIVRQANRPRAADRDGSSEITPELMSITDAACRTSLNLTVAGEFYSLPQKLLLGVTEADFIGPDGTQKTAWQTYISSILALQRDAEGQLPEVKQFDAYDPSVYTKVVEMYASQAAGIMAATPQDLGLYTQGNPVSADAAQVSESRRDRRCRRMQANFGVARVEVAQMAMRFLNGGDLPAGYERVAADWSDPQLPNFTGTADGLTKYMAQGAIVPWSDVALKKAGFDAVQRRQLAAENESPQARAWQFIAQVAADLESKAERAVNALANAEEKAAAPAEPTSAAE